MNQIGSGGVGAVSSGIAEPLVLLLILVLLALGVFVVWKVIKLLLALFG